MIDKDGKRKPSPEAPAIPPHILEDLSPLQKEAFGMGDKPDNAAAAEKAPAEHGPAKHAAKR